MDTKYKRYQKLNESLTDADRVRLVNEVQPCNVCNEEKSLIEFYPLNEDDRAGERCKECIVCRDIRNQEEGARRLALKEKYGDIPVRQARKHEAYAELLATATAQDMFRLLTFKETCVDCQIQKPWIEYYPKDWALVSHLRVESCIVCSDIKAVKKKQIVQPPVSSV